MPITELLERNAEQYADEIALVEINPKVMEHSKVTWREYALIETNPMEDAPKSHGKNLTNALTVLPIFY